MKLLSTLLKIITLPIRFVFSICFKLLIIALIFIIFLLATGNFWVPRVLEMVLRSKSGFNVDINSSDGSLFSANVDLRDISIDNPKPMFYNKNFISINEACVDVDVGSVFSDTFVVEKLFLDINCISIVKNSEGNTNIGVFVKNLTESNDTSNNEQINTNEDKAEYAKAKNFLIKHAIIKLGAVRIIDDSDISKSKIYTINYDKELFDIRSVDEIQAILIKDLGKYGIGIVLDSILDFMFQFPGMKHGIKGLNFMKNTSKGVIGGAKEASKGVLKGAQEGIKGSFNGLRKLFGQ